MDIQLKALHEIPALRDAKIYRPGYAIEYDYFDPTQLKHSLESKIIKGLFFAGQVNGTTGYEEAGGQGTVAGINAALHCAGDKTFEMKRDESYIGVLIDDLTTKGVDEPYRMFTSRAEYRILLRQDDADARLTEKAYELGIAKRDRYDWWMEKKEAIERIIDFCANYPIKKDEINPKLEALGTTPLRAGCKLIDLVARPHLNLQNLSEIIPDLKAAMECASQPKGRDCRGGRNQDEVQRLHRTRATHRRQDAPTGEHQNQGTLQLLRDPRNLHRRTPKARAHRPGNLGSGKPNSGRISKRHQRDCSYCSEDKPSHSAETRNKGSSECFT